MTYSHTAKLKKPSHVRVARVAIFDIGRTRALSASERWVLLTLAILCDYKTGDYPTTLTEMAEDTGLTYEALRRSLDRLEAEGLIQVVEPFRQRSQGRVRVLALDQLVVDAKPVHRALPPEPKSPHLRAADGKPRIREIPPTE